MATVLITGGTGLVGRHLSKKLQEKGYDVFILSRSGKKKGAVPTFTWNLGEKKIENEALNNINYIIHLAGANIGDKRWSPKRKQEILDSRIKTAQLIFDNIKNQKESLKAFISASAIGYYGLKISDKTFAENDLPANDFLGNTCKQWEQMADKFKGLEIRTVKIRTGLVLTKKGGALSKMKLPIKLGIGSAIGRGNQYLPWIHMDDLCGIYIKAIEDKEFKGPFNAVAPDHITNKEFNRILAKVLKKPFWFPNIPAILMKLIFGDMSEIILKGNKVSSDKIQAKGYRFLYPELESALYDLIKK